MILTLLYFTYYGKCNYTLCFQCFLVAMSRAIDSFGRDVVLVGCSVSFLLDGASRTKPTALLVAFDVPVPSNKIVLLYSQLCTA